ncbi:hypothetical protein HAP94_19105 [Acidithiobacillus ferrivorans]|nr:hypothetical protein [Acidithiobacillus ferrivorans]
MLLRGDIPRMLDVLATVRALAEGVLADGGEAASLPSSADLLHTHSQEENWRMTDTFQTRFKAGSLKK